jgi:hypothetical protein
MMEFKWYNEKNDFDGHYGHSQTPMTIKDLYKSYSIYI